MTTQFLSSLKYLQPGDFSCCKSKYNSLAELKFA